MWNFGVCLLIFLFHWKQYYWHVSYQGLTHIFWEILALLSITSFISILFQCPPPIWYWSSQFIVLTTFSGGFEGDNTFNEFCRSPKTFYDMFQLFLVCPPFSKSHQVTRGFQAICNRLWVSLGSICGLWLWMVTGFHISARSTSVSITIFSLVSSHYRPSYPVYFKKARLYKFV